MVECAEIILRTVSVAILSFMGAWSEFLFAVIFTKTLASKTLPVVAASFADSSSIQFDYVMTAGVFTALPFDYLSGRDYVI